MPELPCADAVLHYDQTGVGPDIVWLAAGDMTGASWHEFQIPFFAHSFRNTTYDARGVVPLHVFAFSQDVQAPPARGKLVADTARNGHFHLFEGLGHCSAFGHKPEVVNTAIRDVIGRYSAT